MQHSNPQRNYPGAILNQSAPAPVIVYQLTAEMITQKRWEQIALEVVTLLAGVEGDAAYLVIETPKLNTNLMELTAIMDSNNQPHGGVDAAWGPGSHPVTLSAGADNLHVVLTGLQRGHYDRQYRNMFKVLNLAMEQISQAWTVIRTIKGAFGAQLVGIGQTARRGN